MITFSVFIATSLDGYIARPDGDISWLINRPPPSESEDYGFAEFYAPVDVMVMGRKTYEMALSFPEWPYSGKQVMVLSHKSLAIPQSLAKHVESLSGTPAEVAQTLITAGFQRVYIDGGQTIQSYLRAGLVDEMTITTIPILLGSGIPLFGALDRDISLQLFFSHAYPNGFVQSKYKVTPSN